MTSTGQITAALAKPDATAESLFEAFATFAQECVGAKLFTLTKVDDAGDKVQRIYSNMAEAYPIFGVKPIEANTWTAHVLDRHETFVANDIDGVAGVFSDYELIQSLGCEAVINVPVVVRGHVIGTINCLHESGFYTQERVRASEDLKLPGALCFLTSNSLAQEAQ